MARRPSTGPHGSDMDAGRAVRGFDPDGDAGSGDFDPFADEPDATAHPDDAEDPGGGAEQRGWGWFPVSKPRLPADGIKARSQRGAIATTWWSRRFLAAIETPETASRLTRGKSYARTGQVLSLTIDHAEVRAAVQGSRPKPYAVYLTVPIYRPAEQERIVAALAGQAAFSAALLAGRMPEEIEEVFRPLRLSLFPAMHELDIDCSCPDWGNPCKHAAAVCFLLAERFDADPFDILRWRGLPREELLDGLREHRAQRIGTLPPELPPPRTAPIRSWAGSGTPGSCRRCRPSRTCPPTTCSAASARPGSRYAESTWRRCWPRPTRRWPPHAISLPTTPPTDNRPPPPSRTGSDRARPGRTGPGRVGPGPAGSGRVGSGRVGSGRVRPGRVRVGGDERPGQSAALGRPIATAR
ncbi:hypothetical protein CS0771_69180 [Catellatospora sp. IY07-71]|uniref:SWIM zinc finger family protein n=1 Tax=Catellatospora sp. IY07-71 TaxID=2728827 RepID=UPI001BB30601|nr:SWIM zinc finger family protein [Catellatospora sp. IY07-71]BCJ77374.1 hypothetical protein CS0771_69180 [Catellatospora sp. IY07-71]